MKRKLDVSGVTSRKEEEEEINPYTGRPYTARYYRILEKRMTLPVMQHKDSFLQALRHNKITLLIRCELLHSPPITCKNALTLPSPLAERLAAARPPRCLSSCARRGSRD